jgi:DNA-binding transcriptional ArsR family regulator
VDYTANLPSAIHHGQGICRANFSKYCEKSLLSNCDSSNQVIFMVGRLDNTSPYLAQSADTEIDLFADDGDIDRASRSLKAMSHPLRLKILCTLGDREVSVQDIVDDVGTSQSNISQHLAILRDKGILATRKDANRVYYRVGDIRTLQLIGMMREVFCHQGH